MPELITRYPSDKLSRHADLIDSHGRKIDYIRISLTDRCNFRCIYCMPPDGLPPLAHKEVLSYEELFRLCRIFTALGISRYKITGGEPFCRKGVMEFIQGLRQMSGVSQVTLTTNGSLLTGFAQKLSEIGLNGINVSLDTLNQEHFSAITRSKSTVSEILKAMELAKSSGMKVKINTVPLLGYNANDLKELTAFAVTNGYHIRFIELMPVGTGRAYAGVAQQDIKNMIQNEFGCLTKLEHPLGNGPAQCYSLADYPGAVGFISALSQKFCKTCNRIRLTSAGYLKTCLHHDIGVDLKYLLRNGAGDAELNTAVLEAVALKPLAHEFSGIGAADKHPGFYMNSIGG